MDLSLLELRFFFLELSEEAVDDSLEDEEELDDDLYVSDDAEDDDALRRLLFFFCDRTLARDGLRLLLTREYVPERDLDLEWLRLAEELRDREVRFFFRFEFFLAHGSVGLKVAREGTTAWLLSCLFDGELDRELDFERLRWEVLKNIQLIHINPYSCDDRMRLSRVLLKMFLWLGYEVCNPASKRWILIFMGDNYSVEGMIGRLATGLVARHK